MGWHQLLCGGGGGGGVVVVAFLSPAGFNHHRELSGLRFSLLMTVALVFLCIPLFKTGQTSKLLTFRFCNAHEATPRRVSRCDFQSSQQGRRRSPPRHGMFPMSQSEETLPILNQGDIFGSTNGPFHWSVVVEEASSTKVRELKDKGEFWIQRKL